jgi:hypothetical protein
MQALAALTPPLLVCAVVVIAIVAFLRHEMSRARTDRASTGDEGDIPAAASEPLADKEQDRHADATRPRPTHSGS